MVIIIIFLFFMFFVSLAGIFIPAFVELSTTNVSENMAKIKTAGVDFPIGSYILFVRL